jgi:hypothetical protein
MDGRIFFVLGFLFLTGCVGDTIYPENTNISAGDFETGPGDFCESDDNCWCRSFDGSRFYDERVPSFCDIKVNR